MRCRVVTVLVLLFSISISSTYPNPRPLKHGFAAQLIHRTSPISPFFNSNATMLLLHKHSINVASARNNHFSQPYGSNDALAMPSSHDFVMQFSLGIPPTPTFAIPDTASDLVWLRCGVEAPTLYNPARSYTHRNISCNDPICQSFPQGHCSLDGLQHCNYVVYYPDKSYSLGIIGTDSSFSYQVEHTNNTIDPLFFGCETHSFDSLGQGLPGVVGLRAGGNISLIDQLFSPSFSYCHTEAQLGGSIRFGSESIIGKGLSTPLLPNAYGNYHLRLEGISVDGKDVTFSSDFFEMENGSAETGFIIDTGTMYTLLYTEAYDQVLAAVKNSNPMRDRVAYKDPIWELCYADISGAPEIEMEFTDLQLSLSDANAWVDGPEGLHCLSMQRTMNRLSVLGMYQQRGINVGFDLLHSQVWFAYQNDICPE